MLETAISGVQFYVRKQEQDWVLKNVRLTLKDSAVSIDKRRYKMTRTIDRISYACGCNNGDLKVVFKDDGMETIKSASVHLLD